MKHKSVAAKSLMGIFILVSGLCSAQQPVPQFPNGMDRTMRDHVPVDRTPLTFSSNAQFVLVPVLVTDKNRQPMKGLKKEDFTILENGKAQKISSLEEVATETTPVHRANSAEFSNSYDTGGKARRITIVVLDLVNTPLLDQTRARKAVIKLLAQSPDDGSLIELLVIHSKGISVVQNFTDDPKQLVTAMKVLDSKFGGTENVKASATAQSIKDALMATGQMTPNAATGLNSPAVPFTERVVAFATGADAQYSAYQRDAAINTTLVAFQRIASSVATVPGRKSMIWVTASFPFTIDGDTAEIMGGGSYGLYERTMQLLNSANIAVYPVDVRGLLVLAPEDEGDRFAVGDTQGREDALTQITKNHAATLDTMRSIADMTGGRAYFNRNDIGGAVSEAMQDGSEYYLLSFPLNKNNTQSGWRKLEVKVKGSGLKVRSRQGYFVTRATLDQFQAKQPDLENALSSPLEFTALPITAKWLGKPSNGKTGKVVAFELALPANAISPDETGNKMSLEFLVAATNAQGESKGNVKQSFEGVLPEEDAEKLRTEGVKYKNSMELAPGEYTVHFVVRDNMTGKVGSVIARITIA